MGVFNILYIAEAAIIAIAIIAGLILYKVKHKNGFLKFLGISLGSFIFVFILTFVFERPEVHFPQNDNLEICQIEVGSREKIKIPKTSYHFADVTKNVSINGNIDYNKTGEYSITLEVDTLLGKYIQPAKVKIIDTKAPVIQLEGEEDFKQSYAKEYQEPGVKAYDEYEGDLTEKVKSEKKEVDDKNYKIIYTVEDSSGNKANRVRNVTIIDDVPPVITLNGNSIINLTPNSEYEEKGATAKDEIDGELTEKIVKEGSVDTSSEGTYTIVYKVSDNSGNDSSVKRTIEVRADEPPVQAQSGGGGAGTIYLTFDDGPTTNITPKILDILASKNVKATFFVLNYNESGEALIKREHNEGHTVAIHGYSHDYKQIYQSEEAYMQNILKLQEKIRNTTGYTSTVTRFPGGSSNTISRFNPGIMTRLCRLVQDRGFTYFDWNVDSNDAGGAKDAEAVYNNVIKSLSKSRANVVLMHDFSSNQKGVEALPRIIDYAKANGYTFSNITANTPMVTHKPNN